MSSSTQSVPFAISNETFLKAVFGDRWREALVAYFAGDPEIPGVPNWSVYAAASVLRAMTPDQNNYYDVSLPGPGLGAATRQLTDWGAIYAIVVDDYGVKVDKDRIRAILGCEPSYVIETSPGNFHAGWFVEPLTDRAWVLGMLRALYEALGRKGDNLVKPTTVVRLPVGTNGKGSLGLGPRGWRVRLVEWRPDTRIKHPDWITIEKRLGAVAPADPRVSLGGAMPDPLEIEADLICKVFRGRGMILDAGRSMPFGWGFEVTCPWEGDHTDPRPAASYVPVRQRFKCHHGHCQDRTMADVRAWADQAIREDSGGLLSLAAQEFDDGLDPTTLPNAPGASWDGRGNSDDLYDPWFELEPAPWPGDILPGASWENDTQMFAEVNGYDVGAFKLSYVGAFSAAADKRARFQPYRKSDWAVPPIIWVVPIGDSGLRKTAIWQRALAVLTRLNSQRMARWTQEHAAWRALPAALRKQQPEPHATPLLLNDATVEALQQTMARNPRGVHYARDEIAGLLEFDRYHNAGGKGHNARAFLLEAYEGGTFTANRIGRADLHIDACGLSLGGCIQPAVLAGFKDLTDDGLHQRCSWVVMRASAVERSGQAPTLADIDAAIEKLANFTPAIGNYIANAAGEALIKNTEQYGALLARTSTLGRAFEAVASKLHGLHARLALILHLMTDPTSTVIPEDTIERAGRLTRFVLEHTLLVYDGMPDQYTDLTRTLASYILRFQPTRLTTRTLLQSIAPCRKMNLKEMQGAVSRLVDGGWLKPEEKHQDNRVWLVRPGLAGAFAGRIQTETERVEALKEAFNRLGQYRTTKREQE